MKKFNKVSIVVLTVAFSLVGLTTVLAATTPVLGTSVTYSVLGSTYTNTAAGTVINGDVGFTTGPAVVPGGTHTNYGSGAPYATAGIDQGSALTDLNNQPCTFTFANGPIDLATDTTHGPIGVYTPGVYCTGASSAASIGTGGITLSGSGTYIFRINGALTSVANSVVTLANGTSICDVFWTPTAATTLGANSTFVGTNIDDAGITVGSNVTWTGRALAFGGTVTTNTDTINTPACSVAVTPTPVPTPTPTPSTAPVSTPVTSATPSTNAVLQAQLNGLLVTLHSLQTQVQARQQGSTTPVFTPKLPNTGIAPDENSNASWNIIIPAGILVVLLSFYLLAQKKQLI